MSDIVGPAAAKGAVVIEPEPPSAAEHLEAYRSVLGEQANTGIGRLRLAAIGLGAGFASTVLEQAFWPDDADLSSTLVPAQFAGLALTYLIGMALLRHLGRPSFWDTAFVFVASLVSVETLIALVDTISRSTGAVGPAWYQFLTDPDLFVAYPVLRGVIFGATLVVGSLLLSPRRRL